MKKTSFRAFISSHIDSQLQKTKAEINERVENILKLIQEQELEQKHGVSAESSKKESLVTLIEDFHKHHLSLYEQYDDLRGVLISEVVRDDGDQVLVTDDVDQLLVRENLAVADMRRMVMATTERTEELRAKCEKATSRINEAEDVIRNLELKAKKLGDEKVALLAENAAQKQELNYFTGKEAEMKQRVEEMNKERDELIKMKEIAVKKMEEMDKATEDLEVITKIRNEERAAVETKISSLKAEVSSLKEQLGFSDLHRMVTELNMLKQELRSKGESVRDLSQKLDAETREKDRLDKDKESAEKRIAEVEKTAQDLRSLSDELQDEKTIVHAELENIKKRICSIKQQLEDAEQRVSFLAQVLKVG